MVKRIACPVAANLRWGDSRKKQIPCSCPTRAHRSQSSATSGQQLRRCMAKPGGIGSLESQIAKNPAAIPQSSSQLIENSQYCKQLAFQVHLVQHASKHWLCKVQRQPER